MTDDELPPELREKVRLVNAAYASRERLAREADATVEELTAAITGPARPFYLAACQREDEATSLLPEPEFRDKVERWYKNWREVYRAVVRARSELRAAG